MTTTTDCLFCVDGLAPDTSTVIGACFRPCPRCKPQCRCCDGQGAYPDWTKDLYTFLVFYNAVGLKPVLCHDCCGVVELTPLDPDQETTHDHT